MKWNTCYVDSIILEKDSFYVLGRNQNKEAVSLNSEQVEFDFSFPSVGVLCHKNTVVIGSKYPARQWKKALTQENFKTILPTRTIINNIYAISKGPNLTRDIKWTIEEVHSWFNTSYTPFEEALSLLEANKKQAVALSNQFFVTSSHYGKGFLIWRMFKVIAEVSFDKEITYLCKSFEQELKDFFKRTSNA